MAAVFQPVSTVLPSSQLREKNLLTKWNWRTTYQTFIYAACVWVLRETDQRIQSTRTSITCDSATASDTIQTTSGLHETNIPRTPLWSLTQRPRDGKQAHPQYEVSSSCKKSQLEKIGAQCAFRVKVEGVLSSASVEKASSTELSPLCVWSAHKERELLLATCIHWNWAAIFGRWIIYFYYFFFIYTFCDLIWGHCRVENTDAWKKQLRNQDVLENDWQKTVCIKGTILNCANTWTLERICKLHSSHQ